jgi:hypothetical protein
VFRDNANATCVQRAAYGAQATVTNAASTGPGQCSACDPCYALQAATPAPTAPASTCVRDTANAVCDQRAAYDAQITGNYDAVHDLDSVQHVTHAYSASACASDHYLYVQLVSRVLPMLLVASVQL